MQPTLTGLTQAEVAERIAQGRVNRLPRSGTTELLDIVQRNLFTLFNALVVPAAVVLFLLGDLNAALAVSGMMLVNTVLGLAQEIRAKRQLDRLTLLAETRVRVRREGAVTEIPSGDVVEGDVLLLAAGDSIVADGCVLESRFLEVDEALLTGESDPVPRQVGEQVLSGSFCVAGEGAYRAERVGLSAFAQKTATEARSYQYTASPLQQQINTLIRILTAIAVIMSLAYVVLFFARGAFDPAIDSQLRKRELDSLVRMVAATITSMVPQGLVLMATVALLLGAVSMTAKGVLVNRLAAVEAMASIDTLCMDKTGTLTTNHLSLAELFVFDEHDRERAQRLISLFAHVSLDRENKSLAALRASLPPVHGELLDQLPFKSQNRYSAIRVRQQGQIFALAMGAFEALRPLLIEPDRAETIWRERMNTGWRLLLFCEIVDAKQEKFNASLEGYRLRPVALIALQDELRSEARQVLRQLAEQNISFKVISGDNPETVRATIRPLGQDSDQPTLAALLHNPVVTGKDLESAQDPIRLIQQRNVFGRVSPWQKVQIVRILTATGRKVAMIGDGVNDVLPIKNAALGIAMGEGSRATKTVAGIVLHSNDFSLLPKLLDEGRIILRNLARSGKLFLNKNVYFPLLVVGMLSLDLPFPLIPQQVTLLNVLTIGLPALLIALDRRRATAASGNLVREIGWFVLRSGVLTALAALGIAWIHREESVLLLRTLIVSTLVLLGWVTLYRVSGQDRRLQVIPVFGLGAYLMALYIPPVRRFLELQPLELNQWGMVSLFVGVTALLMWGSDLWSARTQHKAE